MVPEMEMVQVYDRDDTTDGSTSVPVVANSNPPPEANLAEVS